VCGIGYWKVSVVRLEALTEAGDDQRLGWRHSSGVRHLFTPRRRVDQ